jgi:broad specificity polyphosphatase/5'/3'-nucleotidase SurE
MSIPAAAQLEIAIITPAAAISVLRRCFSQAKRLLSRLAASLENDLSSQTLDRIEQELRLLNINLAEANDIAMLAAFRSMPPELDNDSRKALALLRDKMMKRAVDRADI